MSKLIPKTELKRWKSKKRITGGALCGSRIDVVRREYNGNTYNDISLDGRLWAEDCADSNLDEMIEKATVYALSADRVILGRD